MCVCVFVCACQDEIHRYVTFARSFKPYISQDSADHLVQHYKKLRQRDSSGKMRRCGLGNTWVWFAWNIRLLCWTGHVENGSSSFC